MIRRRYREDTVALFIIGKPCVWHRNEMSARFFILVDPSRDLVRIKLSGLYEVSDVEDFVRARNKAHEALRCRPNQHLTLSDVREMKIQLQQVVAAFRNLLGDPRHRSRKLAFLIRPSLTMRQLVRAIDQRDAQCFGEESDALRWLLASDLATTQDMRLVSGTGH